ncbi:hypothetical protein [Rhodovulum sp. PH10]|uniref:hypothetical protein n=1 Tax=Rhodovulum sp. PH10 TaxID=1187851 RepID=UPI003FD34F83
MHPNMVLLHGGTPPGAEKFAAGWTTAEPEPLPVRVAAHRQFGVRMSAARPRCPTERTFSRSTGFTPLVFSWAGPNDVNELFSRAVLTATRGKVEWTRPLHCDASAPRDLMEQLAPRHRR